MSQEKKGNTAVEAFGIDLGTTCSAIGRIVDGRPELIRIDGEVLVPSLVRFDDDGQVAATGTAALNQAALHPDATLRSTKREIGTDHTWQVHGHGITPTDAAEAILRHLIDGAEASCGVRPEAAVITVPAWFSHSARADTQTAAERAGLRVLRLINEPTAAALARDFEDDAEKAFLVFDMGGGTFDASLITQTGALVEVEASHGDTRLGGDDVDEALLELALGRIEDTRVAAVVRSAKGSHAAALDAIRDAKHALSTELQATARAPFIGEVFGEPLHFECSLDRDDVDAALAPMLERALDCVDEVLEAGGTQKGNVDDVLLVGGSTRSTIVRTRLQERYGWPGDLSMPAQEAVALGATIQAGLIAGHGVKRSLIDVTPHALSVTAELHGDHHSRHLVSETITPRNVPLPARHVHRFWTVHPEQSSVEVTVLQGSERNPLRNVALGSASIQDLPHAPEGQHNRPIAVEMHHDLSGVVSVKINDELSGRTAEAAIALSGHESEEARGALLRALEKGGLLPGMPDDPDPFDENREERKSIVPFVALPAPSEAGKGVTSAQTEPVSDSALADARQAFEQVAASLDSLRKSHGPQAAALTKLSSRGLSALEEGRGADALEAYDELGDLMFEEGIYL